MADRKLTERQFEMLKRAASTHGVRTHTRYDVAVMERLFIRGFTLETCNGTNKWFATQAGRDLLASAPPMTAPDTPSREECPVLKLATAIERGQCGDEWDAIGISEEEHASLPLLLRRLAAKPADDGVREGADAMIGEIEQRFPNWKSYRDLVDCIDCTLHALSTKAKP